MRSASLKAAVPEGVRRAARGGLRSWAPWLMLWAATAVAQPAPKAALVVASEAPATSNQIDDYRERYGAHPSSVEWLVDPEVREVLEHPGGFTHGLGQVRDSLDAARHALHRFDLRSAEKELENTFGRAQHLPPTREGRAVYVQATLVSAESAIIRSDVGATRSAFALALSVEPRLTLDPREHSPQMREAFLSARRWLADLPRVSFTVASDVPGAHVIYGGVDRGLAPVRLEYVPATLQVVWVTAPNVAPSALQIRPAPEAVVNVSLASSLLASRVAPLARALAVAGTASERRAAAQRLATQLGVPLIALVSDFSRAPEWLGPFELAPLVPAGPPPRPLPRNGVPAYVLGGVAVGLAGTGILFGELARRDEASAKAQAFGSDGARLNLQARREANVANGAYAGAGAAFLVGAGFFFLF